MQGEALCSQQSWVDFMCQQSCETKKKETTFIWTASSPDLFDGDNTSYLTLNEAEHIYGAAENF